MFEAEAERGGRSENVGGDAKRQCCKTGVEGGHGERDDRSDSSKQRMMNHRETQHPERMMAQDCPVGHDEQETRTDERGKEHEDAEIPDFVGIDLEFARGVKSEHECKQNSQGGSCAV